MTKITSNIMKVGVHWNLPNAKINLQSNFHSEKLVKSETLLYGFAEVGIKGVKYSGTSQNFTCTLVYQMSIQIYDQMVKSETPSCGFSKVWLKGGKKSSEHH